MYSELSQPNTRGEIAARFHVLPEGAGQAYVAHNLNELLVHDLAILVAGANSAESAARSLSVRLPREQLELRGLVHGLGLSCRSCLPDLPCVLIDEGIVLPTVRDTVIEDLLAPILDERDAEEPDTVHSARIAGVLHKVATLMEARLMDASADAHLLGVAPLHSACREWTVSWIRFRGELAAHRRSFRALAYPAEKFREFA